jgi:predicted dehydrogenase
MTTRVAIVGCGLIAQRAHIPAVLRCPDARLTVICDQSREHAEAVRRDFGLACDITTSVDAVGDFADAAIVATPNATHADLTARLLRQGVHVLCEKPLALSLPEGRALVALAGELDRVLAVGFVHRFHETTALLKTIIQNGTIGAVRRYQLQLGVKFEWAAVSGFYFDRARAGGGVLISEAIHWLDRLIFWFGMGSVTRSLDNNHGGIETDSELWLAHDGDSGAVDGVARFSWLYDLRNTLEVVGTEGRAVISKDSRSCVAVHRYGNRDLRWEVRPAAGDERPPQAYFDQQLQNFLDAIVHHRPLVAPGRSAIDSIALVSEAYRLAVRYPHSWSVMETV